MGRRTTKRKVVRVSVRIRNGIEVRLLCDSTRPSTVPSVAWIAWAEQGAVRFCGTEANSEDQRPMRVAP